MATAEWVTDTEFKERLGKIEAQGYDDRDLQKCLYDAEEDLKTELVTIFPADTVNGWIDETVPRSVKNLVKDLAAAYFFNRIMHESFEDRDSLACSFKKQVEREVEKIRLGKKQILDTSGDEVGESEETIYSNTSSRTPHVSMIHPDDGDFGDGSMDEW